LISHNPDDVKSFGDEIIEISQGRHIIQAD